VVGSPRYLEQRGTPSEPEDLLRHDCVRLRFPSGRLFSWDFEKGGRSVTISPEGRLVVRFAVHDPRRRCRIGSGLPARRLRTAAAG
jgi:hypothetical protein